MRWRKRHFDAFRQSTRRHGLGLEHDIVKTRRVHLLPDLDQVAVRTLHQAIHHFDHIQTGTQRAVDGAHFEPDDAAAQNQHALGNLFELQGAGGVDHARVVGHEGQAHGLRTGCDDGVFEGDDFLGAGLVLA